MGRKEFIVSICSLRQTIRVQEKLISLVHVDFKILIYHIRHYTNSKVMFGLKKLKLSSLVVNRRILMPCVHKRESACRKLHNAEPYCDKQVRFVVLTDVVVYILHDLRRRAAHAGPYIDHDVGRHHEQRRRYALVRDVADPHAQMVVVDQHVTIKVSPHLSGRDCTSIDVKIHPLRKCRILGRK